MIESILINRYRCPDCGSVNPEHVCEDPNGGDGLDDTAGSTAEELEEELYRGGIDEGS